MKLNFKEHRILVIGRAEFIDSGNEIMIKDLASKNIKLSKRKIKARYDESRERPYDVNRLICNNNKALKFLNWKPKIFVDKGLSLTYKWAEKNQIKFSASFKKWYYKN